MLGMQGVSLQRQLRETEGEPVLFRDNIRFPDGCSRRVEFWGWTLAATTQTFVSLDVTRAEAQILIVTIDLKTKICRMWECEDFSEMLGTLQTEFDNKEYVLLYQQLDRRGLLPTVH